MQDWKERIFSEEISFEEKAREVFAYQYENNIYYRRYCNALHIVRSDNESKLYSISDVTAGVKEAILESARNDSDHLPLFPIRGFKDATITCLPDTEHELVFRSSGTSGMHRSTHLVAQSDIYRESVLRGFRHFYDTEQATILAYTPGYSENPDSSLVWMLKELIANSESDLSRFLPLGEPLVQKDIDAIASSGNQIILFGAAFGLVDLVESSSAVLPGNSIVIETGGMKTHKREMGRTKMHRKLAEGFGIALDRVHSEYGMAELLSQAYAQGGKWFRTVPWLKVTVRDAEDPQKTLPAYQEGLIGIIDLANVHSCSFILTGDKGIMD
ncbi:MAG: hypothetical protein R3222_10465, partial [Balneolaceae bacterium]|nr:hypothetical protein [Balneolaceae bacterium]